MCIKIYTEKLLKTVYIRIFLIFCMISYKLYWEDIYRLDTFEQNVFHKYLFILNYSILFFFFNLIEQRKKDKASSFRTSFPYTSILISFLLPFSLFLQIFLNKSETTSIRRKKRLWRRENYFIEIENSSLKLRIYGKGGG